MVAINWRRIPTVLQPDELMDKAFSAATKKANLVDDPDKYHRVRKQMLAEGVRQRLEDQNEDQR